MARWTHRALLAAGLVLAVGTAAATETPVALMTPDIALEQVEAGAITLVDIREPDEWAETGVAAGAERIAMRDPALGQKLLDALDGDRDRPIALICRTGARSGAVAAAMAKHGFTNVYSVEGGMMGRGAEPGWLRRDLPLARGTSR